MARRSRGGRSYGQTRAYMEGITDRHTRGMLSKAQSSSAKKPPDPLKVMERKKMLEDKGLLSLLEKGIPCPVRLPGNKQGIATGITDEGFVLIKNWSYLFHPRVIQTDKPART